MKNQKLPIKYPILHQESKEIKRITFRNGIIYILEALNLQKGWLYTIKTLFLNPGGLVKYYLGEGRYNTISPWKLLFLTTAISLFLSIQFKLNELFTSQFISSMNESGTEIDAIGSKVFSYLNDYYNIIVWSSIPAFALAFFLFLRRGFNYFEHVVIYTYYLVLGNLIYILSMPVFAYTNWGFELYMLISHFYLFYIYNKALELSKWYHYVKIILGILIAYLLYFILLAFTMVPFIIKHAT